MLEVQGQRGFQVDDVGIFYRYAENLASGHGWTYNLGRHDPGGITSPLYVILLALLSKLGFTIPGAATLIFAIGTGGASVLLFRSMSKVGHPIGGLSAGILIVTSPWLVAVRGMESALMLGLLALSVWLYLEDRYIPCGFALGFLVLTRPDSIFFAVSLGLYHLVRKRQIPWRIVIPASGVVGVWIVYAAIAVGVIVPDTLRSKIDESRIIDPHSAHEFFRGFWQDPTFEGFRVWAAMVGGLAVVGVAAFFWRRWKLDAVVTTLVLGSALLLLFYDVILNLAQWWIWYYVPFVYTICALAGLATEGLLTASLNRLHKQSIATALLLTIVVSVTGVTSTPRGWQQLRASYILAATWVRAHSFREDSVASSEIGLIGWYSQRRMIDSLGLFTPSLDEEFVHHRWLYWVRHYPPTFYIVPVGGGWPWDVALEKQQWFGSTFILCYRSPAALVYRRIAPVQ
ncbi:MAG TPA: hypothetical protein VFZ97_13720 [Acidimicrobiales bacterium]